MKSPDWPIPFVHDPARKLSREEFEWACIAGLGRAWMFVERYGDRFPASFERMTVETPAIDPQADGRESLVFKLLSALDDPMPYLRAAIDAPYERDECGDPTRDQSHRTSLLADFADAGVAECVAWQEDRLHVEEIAMRWVRTDVANRLPRVVRTMMARGLDGDQLGRFVQALETRLDAEIVWYVLEENKSDEQVAEFVARYRRVRREWEADKQERATTAEVLPFAEITTGPNWANWFEEASESQLDELLEYIVSEQPRWTLCASRWAMSGRQLHRFEARLVGGAGASNTLLATFPGDEVLALGRARLAAGEIRTAGTLLAARMDEQLVELLVRALPREMPIWVTGHESGHDLHEVALGCVAVLDASNEPGLEPVARWVYATAPCSHCRRSAVRWLAEVGRLPAEVEVEEAVSRRL